MLKDQYDNVLSTSSPAAQAAYITGLDRILMGSGGVAEAFETATKEDPGFALGWVGRARAAQYSDDIATARQCIAQAQTLTKGLTDREASHVNAFGLLLTGQVPAAYKAIRAHVDTWPRDPLVAQTSSSVFGLIGFSGLPGREAETLAFVAGFLPHYGEDAWAIGQYAFALCETGNLARADTVVDHALSLRSDNAHGAHVRSHVSYELGQTDVGRGYLADFMSDYDPEGILYTHLNWHESLWALEQGDLQTMWAKVDAAVMPEAGSSSPAINVLTDTAAILHRAAMAGVEVSPARWRSVSDFAQKAFPKTGMVFVDVHAALAHAMAGRSDALDQIINNPAGPAGDMVPELAKGFRAIASEDWENASGHLMAAMSDLARMGGSRAQRDLVEQTLLTALVKQGKTEQARDIARLRRPLLEQTVAA